MKLGVIGCGKMGTALVAGAVRSGVVMAEDVLGTDVIAAARENFAKETGGRVCESAAEVVAGCEVILLCVKPHDVFAALGGLDVGGEGRLVVSIAAGVGLKDLEAGLPAAMRVVRTMPNTPALVGAGAAGFCMGERCLAEDEEVVRSLLGSVGLAVKVPERLLDAVTGLSGSGPAYVYLMIEAMADGGLKAGLGRADALTLAAQTVAGAAAMVLKTGEHPAVLKDMVTSPGGTTIAGLAVLEERGVRAALIEAVGAAAARATELGRV